MSLLRGYSFSEECAEAPPPRERVYSTHPTGAVVGVRGTVVIEGEILYSGIGDYSSTLLSKLMEIFRNTDNISFIFQILPTVIAVIIIAITFFLIVALIVPPIESNVERFTGWVDGIIRKLVPNIIRQDSLKARSPLKANC